MFFLSRRVILTFLLWHYLARKSAGTMVVLRGRARPWQPWMLYQSRRRILKLAIVSRFLVLIGMMASDRLIPNHNPGDDVLQFNLRLSSDCFCQEGLACLYDTDGTIGSCYVSETPSVIRSTITGFYKLMLPPLTRWDAARFLSLAANPEIRQPKQDYWKEKECEKSGTPQEVCDAMKHVETEQSHAFFPGFPTLIRIITRHVVHWIPWILLPPTFESVLVLVAWWINTVAFIFAALALHELTYCVTKKYVVSRELCVQCAYTSALIFSFNPAIVFFSTAYSESLFCMLTFSGYFFAERNNFWFAMICWIASSYIRSNGSMILLWLTLDTVARCLHSPRTFDDWFGGISALLFQAMLILFPILSHDWNGYYLHCIQPHHLYQPSWCKDAFPIIGVYQYFELLDVMPMEYFKTFSLYKYVQRKYWNVGFLRYYEWKQIPNFLLAFPVLFLGTCAVVTWIRQSVKLFVKDEKSPCEDNAKGWRILLLPFYWAIFALLVSVESPVTTIKDLKERDQPKVVLVGPTLLAYYAVLGAACIVGATIAHVQISTRFIFSSCPAIYWYIAFICITNNKRKSRGLLERLLLSRNAMVCYCAGFILAGVIMHPNWLPWT